MNKLFSVPSDLLADFSQLLVENQLVNEIKGSNEDNEILIEVNYRSDQKGAILDLLEWLEDNIVDMDDDDDDDKDEDEDEDPDNDEDDSEESENN